MVEYTDLFLSYAWKDDPNLVKRLHGDLTAAGYKVWWDRTRMGDRVVPLNQQVRDAVDATGRLIVVMGQAALQSHAVKAEWNYAFSICKPVIVLRLGEISAVPSELRKFYCPDFRKARPYKEALAELLRILKQPIEPLGNLFGVPQLPKHFQPRPEHIQSLHETLMADVDRPVVITSAQQTAALQGMAGIGKSVLAAAFARDCATRRSFGDGVIWIKVGEQPDLVALAGMVAAAAGDDEEKYTDLERSTTYLSVALKDRVCLLVLDDVWKVEDATLFRNALGPRCRLLLTTRDGGLVTALGAWRHAVETLSDEAALQLLAQWSGQPVEKLPAEARSVACRCGNLPLALAESGATVGAGNRWEDVATALAEADVSYIAQQFPDYPYLEPFKAHEVSVSFLRRQNLDAARRYLELGVFPRGEAVPEAAVTNLWTHGDHFKERDARKLITDLHNRALIQRLEGEPPNRRIVLHDLQYDYLRTAKERPAGLHEKLLEAYRARCHDGWHTGPNDDYFYQHLAYHLREAGRQDELRRLLRDFNWVQAKLDATDVTGLLTDFDALATPHPQPVSPADSGVGKATPFDFGTGGARVSGAPGPVRDPAEEDLSIMRWALLLSAHALAQDKSALAGQLLGRLLAKGSPAIETMLEQAKSWRGAPWLRPSTASLTLPRGPLLTTLRSHTGVAAAALTADGRHLVSASEDGTLEVWDVDASQVVHRLTGHLSTVTALALQLDGVRAISGSADGTLKVWDWALGRELHTLRGHAESVVGVALSADGRRAVSAFADGMLDIWDLCSGAHTKTLRVRGRQIAALSLAQDGRSFALGSCDGLFIVWDLDTSSTARTIGQAGQDDETCQIDEENEYWLEERRIREVAVTAEGHRGVIARRDSLEVWDLADARLLYALHDYHGAISALAISTDGRLTVSGSLGSSVRVWDITKGQELFYLRGHANGIAALALTPDGSRMASASTEGTLKVWDLQSGWGCPLG